MKKILLLFLLFPFLSQAQLSECAADFSQLSTAEKRVAERFYQNIQQNSALRSDTFPIDSIPITIHVVSEKIDYSNFDYQALEEELVLVNRVFESIGAFFYLCGPTNFITGEWEQTRASLDEYNAIHHVPNTINIYYVESYYSEASERYTCGFAYLPFYKEPKDRYITIANPCGANGATLAHELGHFYGLFHTHYSGRGEEYADGSNCREAGDRICDTPADPDLGQESRRPLVINCEYVGNLLDPQGDPYTPPVSNFMSYAPASCRVEFSETQLTIMRATHTFISNNYVGSDCDLLPDIVLQSDLEYLEVHSLKEFNMNFQLEAKDIQQAVSGVLEVRLFQYFEQEDRVILHREDLSFLPGQDPIQLSLNLRPPNNRPSDTYFIVTRFKPDERITERTRINNYHLTQIDIDNSGYQAFSLIPNPAVAETNLFLRDAVNTGSYTIRVFRYDGTQVLTRQGYKDSEELLHQLDFSQLPPGVYIIFLDFENSGFRQSLKFVKSGR